MTSRSAVRGVLPSTWKAPIQPGNCNRTNLKCCSYLYERAIKLKSSLHFLWGKVCRLERWGWLQLPSSQVWASLSFALLSISYDAANKYSIIQCIKSTVTATVLSLFISIEFCLRNSRKDWNRFYISAISKTAFPMLCSLIVFRFLSSDTLGRWEYRFENASCGEKMNPWKTYSTEIKSTSLRHPFKDFWRSMWRPPSVRSQAGL